MVKLELGFKGTITIGESTHKVEFSGDRLVIRGLDFDSAKALVEGVGAPPGEVNDAPPPSPKKAAAPKKPPNGAHPPKLAAKDEPEAMANGYVVCTCATEESDADCPVGRRVGRHGVGSTAPASWPIGGAAPAEETPPKNGSSHEPPKEAGEPLKLEDDDGVPDALAEAASVGEVVKHFRAKGMTLDEIVAACERSKGKIRVLSKVANIGARVKRVLEALQDPPPPGAAA